MYFLAPVSSKIVLDSNAMCWLFLYFVMRKLARIRSYDSDGQKEAMISNNTRFLVIGAGIIAASLMIALIGSLK